MSTAKFRSYVIPLLIVLLFCVPAVYLGSKKFGDEPASLPAPVPASLPAPAKVVEDPVVDSDTGHYSLQRLCTETLRDFYSARSGDDTGGPLVTERFYPPEYVPEAELPQHLQGNKAKTALLEAAKVAYAELKKNRVANTSKIPAVRDVPGIDAIYNALKAGQADGLKLYKQADLRWKAGFDLALGRAMAYKTRADGYICMRAVANRDQIVWGLEASNDPSGNTVVDKLARGGRKYLRQINQEHAGTAWAESAERELQVPIGWKYVKR